MRAFRTRPLVLSDDLVVPFDQVAEYLRLDTTDDQATVLAIAKAAGRRIEVELGNQQLLPATYRQFLDRFPPSFGELLVARPPLIAVESIMYTDPDGQVVELTDYQVDASSSPARLFPAPGATWPDVHPEYANAVEIDFRCGHVDADEQYALPDDLAIAVLAFVAYCYENRGDAGQSPAQHLAPALPLTTQVIVDGYKLYRV